MPPFKCSALGCARYKANLPIKCTILCERLSETAVSIIAVLTIPGMVLKMRSMGALWDTVRFFEGIEANLELTHLKVFIQSLFGKLRDILRGSSRACKTRTAGGCIDQCPCRFLGIWL